MNKDIAVLNEIYKNAQTGAASLLQISHKVDEPALKSDIDNQIGRYREFENKARSMLKSYSVYPKGTSLLNVLPAKAGIAIDTMLDSSPSHIAEMIINGNTMGIIQMAKTMNDATSLSPGIQRLGQQIVNFERQSISTMKNFL